MANTTIDVDFDKLDIYIKQLKNLLNDLDEPSYDKLEFWVGNTSGSGIVLDSAYSFCNRTIDFHNGVHALIKNTIAYLNEVKKLKDADQSIADKL